MNDGMWMVLFHKLAVAAARGLFASVLTALEFLVVGIGALVEFHIAGSVERQDMGAYAVKEPAVVAYHHGASGEVLKALFERTECVDVNIIGRFVKQKHVALLF